MQNSSKYIAQSTPSKYSINPLASMLSPFQYPSPQEIYHNRNRSIENIYRTPQSHSHKFSEITNSASPNIGYSKKEFLDSLKQQVLDKEFQKKREKALQMAEDRAILKIQESYNPYGKPGMGTPLKDVYGNIVSRRQPPLITNKDLFISKLQDDIINNKSKYETVDPNYKEIELENANLRPITKQKPLSREKMPETYKSQNTQVLNDILTAQVKLKETLREEERRRKAHEEKLEEIRLQRERKELQEEYEREQEERRRKIQEVNDANLLLIEAKKKQKIIDEDEDNRRHLNAIARAKKGNHLEVNKNPDDMWKHVSAKLESNLELQMAEIKKNINDQFNHIKKEITETKEEFQRSIGKVIKTNTPEEELKLLYARKFDNELLEEIEEKAEVLLAETGINDKLPVPQPSKNSSKYTSTKPLQTSSHLISLFPEYRDFERSTVLKTDFLGQKQKVYNKVPEKTPDFIDEELLGNLPDKKPTNKRLYKNSGVDIAEINQLNKWRLQKLYDFENNTGYLL